MVATNYAVMAADLALEGASGRMVALRSGTYTTVPISATREGVKRVDVDELYDVDAVPAEGPPRRSASRCSCTDARAPRRLTKLAAVGGQSVIGILTAGGDCPGLNAVIRAVVTACDARARDRGRRDPERLGRADGGRHPAARPRRRARHPAARRHDPRHLAEGPVRPRRRATRACAGRSSRTGSTGSIVVGGDGTLRTRARASRRRGCRWSASRRRSTTTSPAPT